MTTPLRDGLLYFNPRSHEGSDEDGSSLTAVTIGISIHAPTRGATMQVPPVSGNLQFQSTLPQGERPCLLEHQNQMWQNFNPRSHKGSDLLCLFPPLTIRFQSTLPQGERLMAEVKDAGLKLFQSTLPQGERLLWIALNVNKKIHFNPRSHKGSDRKITSLVDAFFLFQSTLPQGERHWVCRQCITYVTISIHAPTRGATETEVVSPLSTIFQSTLPQGERLHGSKIDPCPGDFNPRSHKGSDDITILK